MVSLSSPECQPKHPQDSDHMLCNTNLPCQLVRFQQMFGDFYFRCASLHCQPRQSNQFLYISHPVRTRNTKIPQHRRHSLKHLQNQPTSFTNMEQSSAICIPVKSFDNRKRFCLCVSGRLREVIDVMSVHRDVLWSVGTTATIKYSQTFPY